jgi:hypothetical protein
VGRRYGFEASARKAASRPAFSPASGRAAFAV